MARLLAFDVGRTFAWAYGDLVDPLPNHIASHRLASSSVRDLLGARMDVFDRWLDSHLFGCGATHVVMAERFRSRTTAEAASNYALDGLVRMHCYRRHIPLLCQPEGTVRKEILGRGSGPSDELKRLAAYWCADQGLAVTNDHEADACVLWAWAARELIATASSAQPDGAPQDVVVKKQRNKVSQKTNATRLRAANPLV